MRVGRLLKMGLVSAGLILLAGIVAGAAFRAYVQHVRAEAMTIRTQNGIDEAMYVKLGGIEQWVQIRGSDRANPVLLCVHGGPGATWTPLIALFLSWEKDFTVVQWDQRGAGKTLETTGPTVASTMSIERMVQDGIELTEYLERHLGKERIILLGHSWGSILGVEMVRRRPELFYAYVGTGQVSSLPRAQDLAYRDMVRAARASGDADSMRELERLGPPPFDSMGKVATYFEMLGRFAPESDREAVATLGRLLWTAPNYSLRDIYHRAQGFARVPTWELYRSMLSTDFMAANVRIDVPMFIFQGAEDNVTPASLAQDFFDRVQAPHKEFVAFPREGHFAVWHMAQGFGRELATRLRPFAQPSSR